ncbi:S8 family serine peptidase, partial [Escherichia coli]|uniref:S8 family serine peptidase n=1 Tax=Escherichia coli TaxID=562 RepID=UPI0021154FD4
NGQDCNGHGTHVAGTVGGTTYGVAKGVDLVAVRVLGCDGKGSTSGVIAGVDWVTANAAKPAVANMSLGGGISSALDAAVRRSVASGVTYTLA